MPSYSWWQALRVLAGQDPGAADLPDTDIPVLEVQPARVTSLLADGVAVVLGVPSGGDLHEEIPAPAWRRIRIELRTSRTNARCVETVAALPHPLIPDVLASRFWKELQITDRELVKLKVKLEEEKYSPDNPPTYETSGVQSPTIAAERKCLDWLVTLMQASPNPSAPKDNFLKAAKEQFPRLGNRGFERAWRQAIQKTGSSWGKSGAKPKTAKSNRDAIPE
jgi:hypothetical protein